MSEEEKKELRPFVLKFNSEPEIYDISGLEVENLNLDRAKKLKLSDIYKAGSSHTCTVDKHFWTPAENQGDTVTDTIPD